MYLFDGYQVVTVKDLAYLRPETVDRIKKIYIFENDVLIQMFDDACDEQRKKRAQTAVLS